MFVLLPKKVPSPLPPNRFLGMLPSTPVAPDRPQMLPEITSPARVVFYTTLGPIWINYWSQSPSKINKKLGLGFVFDFELISSYETDDSVASQKRKSLKRLGLVFKNRLYAFPILW